jgi:hypothetical protein
VLRAARAAMVSLAIAGWVVEAVRARVRIGSVLAVSHWRPNGRDGETEPLASGPAVKIIAGVLEAGPLYGRESEISAWRSCSRAWTLAELRFSFEVRRASASRRCSTP